MPQEWKVGTIVEGRVAGITGFGAFVSLPNGKQGLVHISEVATEYVRDVHDYLKEGQKVRVKILGTEKGKIGLSIKKALEEEKKAEPASEQKKSSRPGEIDWSRPSAQNLSFEEKMSRFKSDSEERISDFNRNVDHKRSGGYNRRSN